MAEVTGLRNNALPYPVYGVPWGVVFPMLDADGDLVTGATTPDAEKSLNGDTFSDCTNESTEIATNSGMWYLLLTGAEMTADVVAVIAKSATAGMKTTPIVLYPAKLVSLRAGTVGANAGDGTTLQLDSSAVAVDDYYNGCLLVGTLDSVVEARVISDYAGSTKVCTVSPAFVTTPDNNDTFVVYQPWGRQFIDANAMAFGSVALTSAAGIPEVKVASIANDAITAAAIAANAIGAAEIADGAIDAATFAAGAITATVIADGAIDAATFAASAITSTVLANDAITAAKLHADVTTELQTGLATATALATAQTSLDDLPTNAELATALGTADDAVLTAIGDLPTNAELATALGTADDAILARLPAALTADGNMKADVLRINGNATGAANLAKTTHVIGRGTCDAAGSTTSIITSAFAPAGGAADQFKGRIITFDADTTTAALRGQATDITASSNVATPVFTVTALTTAPVSGDTFSVT